MCACFNDSRADHAGGEMSESPAQTALLFYAVCGSDLLLRG